MFAGLQLSVWLAAALALSVLGNLYQWRSSAVDEAEQAAAIVLATEQGKTAALAEAAERSALIATQARIDETALLTDLQAIADRASKTTVVYRDRVRTLPAATCAPGADRVAAANALIAGEGK